MKIFNFDNYREIAEKARTDYGWVQKSKVFCDEAISEEKIVDDIISDDPSKSNKLVLLSEAGNGKSTIARQLITMFGDKYPDVSFTFEKLTLESTHPFFFYIWQQIKVSTMIFFSENVIFSGLKAHWSKRQTITYWDDPTRGLSKGTSKWKQEESCLGYECYFQKSCRLYIYHW